MPKKLLVLDVEGTLFETAVRLPGTDLSSTIWQAIAEKLGPEAIEAEINTHRKWSAGQYRNYLDWMRETIEIHRRYGLTETLFSSLISNAKYAEGVPKTLNALDRTRFEVVLISGGFRELAGRAQRDFDIQHAFAGCEYLFSQGRLVSYNILPCDFAGKVDFIHLMLKEYGLASEDWVFVGDGLNDVPIAKESPLSICVNGHAALRKVATVSVESFTDVLKYLD
jgi:phosphoserine phosphatase